MKTLLKFVALILSIVIIAECTPTKRIPLEINDVSNERAETEIEDFEINAVIKEPEDVAVTPETTPESKAVLRRAKRGFGACAAYLTKRLKAPTLRIALRIANSRLRHICGKRKFNFVKELTQLYCPRGFRSCSKRK